MLIKIPIYEKLTDYRSNKKNFYVSLVETEYFKEIFSDRSPNQHILEPPVNAQFYQTQCEPCALFIPGPSQLGVIFKMNSSNTKHAVLLTFRDYYRNFIVLSLLSPLSKVKMEGDMNVGSGIALNDILWALRKSYYSVKEISMMGPLVDPPVAPPLESVVVPPSFSRLFPFGPSPSVFRPPSPVYPFDGKSYNRLINAPAIMPTAGTLPTIPPAGSIPPFISKWVCSLCHGPTHGFVSLKNPRRGYCKPCDEYDDSKYRDTD